MAAPVQCVHHKHVAGAPSPVQSCVATRYTVLTPAASADDTPALESVIATRYVIVDANALCAPVYVVHTDSGWFDWLGGGGGGGGHIGVPSLGGGHFKAPEIDPGSAISALTILAMSLAVIRSKR